VELDPSYFVLPPEIISAEESQTERAANQKVPVPKTRLAKIFEKLDAGGCDAEE